MAVSIVPNCPSIVEQGTSGIWTYRKWSDGVAECFGVATITISEWQAWGGVYYSKPIDTKIAYPSGLFISRPSLIYAPQGSNIDVWVISGVSGTKDQTDALYFCRATTGIAGTKGMALHAIGKWK